MRLGDGLVRLRELLQAPSTGPEKFSEEALVRHINTRVRSRSRKMSELNLGYFNHTFTLAASAARQTKSDVFEYTTPPWIQRVVRVYQYSPTTGPAPRGHLIHPATEYQRVGWLWNGPDNLQLRGWYSAIDMEIVCAKTPSRATKGTLPTQNLMGTSQMRLDADTSADALICPHETLPNSYANALVEITGQTARSGQRRRVTGSTHFQNEAGTLYTVLTVEPAWTTQPIAGDTYEFHLEIADEHMELVLLEAAYTAWGTRGKSDEQRAMAVDIARESAEFDQRVTPRQLDQPVYMRHTIAQTLAGSIDEDKPYWSQ